MNAETTFAEMLRENPDVLLVAELSRKYPTLTVPFLAELVEFVRCWEPDRLDTVNPVNHIDIPEQLAEMGWLGTLQLSRTSDGWYIAKRVKVRKRWRTAWCATTYSVESALEMALNEALASA